ncbi:MAG TPA: AIR synthase [Clostridiales bacterium]|nr:AIR synthase [Clostridiales bacterium]
MDIGKLPNPILHEYVLSKFQHKRDEVLIGPEVGRDCGVIDLGKNLCVVSTDPITAASQNAGYIGVHIACNDIATTGAECVGITLTILAASDSDIDDIEAIVKDVNKAADELSIDILGGHTEVTDSVNRTILSITAIGKVKKEGLIQPKHARIGDSIVMTKWAGMEGTAILAYDKYDSLKEHIPEKLLNEAKSFLNKISVVSEGKIAASLKVHGMHDATEGGIIGALWELSQVMGKSIEIHADDIPIAFVTKEICDIYDMDPLKLISSGTMIIVTPDANKLVAKLEKFGINSSIIGEVIEGTDSYIIRDGERRKIEPPEADHLIKAYNE